MTLRHSKFSPLLLAATLAFACGDQSDSGSEGSKQAADSGPTAKPLERSNPEAEGITSSGVLALVQELEESIDEIHSLILLRHGKVVAEGFWNPYSAVDRHVMYSVSKSVNATAVGLAIDEGLLTVDDTVSSFFPDFMPAEPDPRVVAMTVKNLLTMSTGHAGDEMGTLRQAANNEWTKEFFTIPLVNDPGSTFFYDSSAGYMLSAIVQKVTGETVLDYLQPRLLKPLGIYDAVWGMSPEGINLGAGGLVIKTEDLAKLGQLYLQGGLWEGEQLIPADWVSDATSKQITNGADNGNWSWGYGYQFWRNPAPSGYRADGALGQFSFVLPEQDVVLAITGGTDDTNGVMEIVWSNLLPAIDAGTALPEDAAALQQLKDKLSSLAVNVAPGSMTSPVSSDYSGQRFTMMGNDRGIEAFSLDLESTPPVLTIEDNTGTHSIEFEFGQWVRGTTNFNKRVNELFDIDNQGIAARAVWQNDTTLTIQLAFNETPYVWTGNFAFDGDNLTVNAEYNVRWGSRVQPPMVGTK